MYVEFFNAFNICLNSHRWFLLCLLYISSLVLVLVLAGRDYLYQLGPTEKVPPEDGEGIQSLKRCMF
jgi:hypothetical protein